MRRWISRKPANEVRNLIRGCDPQPGSYADADGRRIRLYEPSLEMGGASAAPGTIVSIGGDGMKIALAGGTITIKRARVEPDAKKVAPAELRSSGAIRAGMKLLIAFYLCAFLSSSSTFWRFWPLAI